VLESILGGLAAFRMGSAPDPGFRKDLTTSPGRCVWMSHRSGVECGTPMLLASRLSGSVGKGPHAGRSDALWAQYSPLITKYEPRMVPASFDFWRANLNESNSGGMSMPSDSLNPTARFGLGPSMVYKTLIDSPLS